VQTGNFLCAIFAIIAATVYSLKLVKENKQIQARKFDMIAAQVALLLYLLLNIYFIARASS
jgi:hypothetical protein